MDKLKKKISQAFKLSGFVIRSENSAYLAEQLLPFEPTEHDKWLTTVIENIQTLKLDSTNIDRTIIEKAIVEINRVGLQDDETVFSIINAFDIPRFVYDSLSKKFVRDKSHRSMLANHFMLGRHLRQRYEMLYQKTSRHELFSPSIIHKANGDTAPTFKLYRAENLLASSEVKEAVLLGQLNEIEEGKFFIEDPTGYVQVDLSKAVYNAGFFCEGAFVLAEGSYENNILKVSGLGFPPAEPASTSRAFFGTANSWGGPSEKLLKYSVALQEVERTNTEATMVFLADVELDVPEVIKKLRKLFIGYDSCPPLCIVLMGPFSTTAHNLYDLVPLFKKLAEATAGCDQLKKETDLIIVPHADDPIQTFIYPRLPIPDEICADLLKAWPRTKLVTNPCRLQYCTQQIVLFRLDLMARLVRNSINVPDVKAIDDHFARTLICQGHLAPLTRYKNPIYWDYDTSMWLYPLPDLVVIGDTCQSFSTTQHGCTILNTGSFLKSKFTFKMYIPSTKTIEDSEIPDGFGDDDAREEETEEIPVEMEEDETDNIVPDTGITGRFVDDENSAITIESDVVFKEPEKSIRPSGLSQEEARKLLQLSGEESEDIHLEVDTRTNDDFEMTEKPAAENNPPSPAEDPDVPGVSGLGRAATRELLAGTENGQVSAVRLESDDSDTEDFLGINTEDPKFIEEERKKIVQQLELESESDSSDD